MTRGRSEGCDRLNYSAFFNSFMNILKVYRHSFTNKIKGGEKVVKDTESISERIKARHKERTKLNYTNNMEAERVESTSDSDEDDDGTAAYRYFYVNSADEGDYEYNDY